jgi:hypothetical protein
MRHLRALTPALSLCLLFASVACDEKKPAETPAPAAQAEPAKTPEAPTAPAEAPKAPEAANADPMKGLPQIPEPVLPTFTDPPEGPRTPAAKALGFEIGVTTHAQALEFAAKNNLTCRDTSSRAMFVSIYNKYKEKGAAGMHGMHGDMKNPHGDGAANPHAANPHAANPHAAPADAKHPHAHGDGAANPHAANPHAANPHAAHGDVKNPHGDAANPHAAPGEDMKKTGGHAHGDYTEMAKNPQIRLSCEPAASTAFADRERPAAEGRLLLIFDSEQHPLRLVSFSRQHKDSAVATTDFEAALKAAEAVYGKPTESEGEVPKGGLQGFASVRRAWKFADFTVVITGNALGASGIQVDERFDVPTPVRVDAVVKK